jgi:hypothetical protein
VPFLHGVRDTCQGQGDDKAMRSAQNGRTFGKMKTESISDIRDGDVKEPLYPRKGRSAGSSIRRRSGRQELRLGSVKTLYEVRGQTYALELAKPTVGVH